MHLCSGIRLLSWPHFAATVVSVSGRKRENLGENRPACSKGAAEIAALEDNNIHSSASWACVVHGGGDGDVVCCCSLYVVKLAAPAQGAAVLRPPASEEVSRLVQLLKAFIL
jgi:hypothetical protein